MVCNLLWFGLSLANLTSMHPISQEGMQSQVKGLVKGQALSVTWMCSRSLNSSDIQYHPRCSQCYTATLRTSFVSNSVPDKPSERIETEIRRLHIHRTYRLAQYKNEDPEVSKRQTKSESNLQGTVFTSIYNYSPQCTVSSQFLRYHKH